MIYIRNNYFIKILYLQIFIILFGFISYSQNSYYSLLKTDFDRLRKKDNQDSAFIVVTKMNKLALKIEGDSSLNYAVSLRYIGNVFISLNKVDSAIYYYNKSLNYLNKNGVSFKSEIASSLNRLGDVYFNIGKYDLAKLYLTKSLKIRRETSSKLDLECASNLNTLGNLYRDIGDYKMAKSALKESSEIIKSNLGDKHIDYATILNNLGNLYSDISDYDSAESYLKQALLIIKPLQKDFNLDFSSTLNNLGNLYRNIGDYKNAEIFLTEAEDNFKKISGENNFEYASNLNNLGILYDDLSDYKSAELYYRQALSKYKDLFGENNAYYSAVLNNLGLLYSDIGDFKNAELLIKKGLMIRKKILGEQHSDYASSLINLGTIFNNNGDYKRSLFYSKNALQILEKSFGMLHPDYAANLNILGNIYADLGNYTLALKYYKQALVIQKKIFGETNREVASTLSNIGILYSTIRNYKLAVIYLRKSLIVKEKVLGRRHPSYAENLYNLGRVYSFEGDNNKSLNNYESCFEIMSTYICNNFDWLSDREAELFWNQFDSFFNTVDYSSSTKFFNSFKAIELSFNSNLFSKGRLLDVKINKGNYVFSKNDSVNKKIVELQIRLSFLKKTLSKIGIESDPIQFDKVITIADSLDKELNLLWSGFVLRKKEFLITWQEVQVNLSDQEAAIEFIRYKSEVDSSYYYNALILTKTSEHPILVKLCSEKELLKILPEKGFSSYFPLVWAPLEKYLIGIKSIYYCPIGVLNNVPFHALYKQKKGGDVIDRDFGFPMAENDADYLLNKYTLYRLSSMRYLAMGLKVKAIEKIDKSIASFGGADYDYFPDLKTTKYDSSDVLMRSFPNNKKFSYLESSKTEVQNITKKLNSEGWKTDLFEGFHANEANFSKFQDDRAKAVLHIATHGFVLPDSSKTFFDLNNSSLEYKLSHNFNPLKRSGLIFAGGNWAWVGSEFLKQEKIDLDYGILTAAKISDLNLRGTKLVVLSACNTGLGKIQGKEGVYGLIRAFKLAGVEQLIVSLWEVPDDYTSELMTYFYDDLSVTQNAIISFENAQKIMQKKYPRRPDWWAAFVLIR